MNTTKGLEYLKWLDRAQDKRFLACRRAGHLCAFRFQLKPGREPSDVPLLCGFIVAGTKCKIGMRGDFI